MSARSALRDGPRTPRDAHASERRIPTCHAAVVTPISEEKIAVDGVAADRGRATAPRIVGERAAGEARDAGAPSAIPSITPSAAAARAAPSAERRLQKGRQQRRRHLVPEIGEQARGADRADAGQEPAPFLRRNGGCRHGQSLKRRAALPRANGCHLASSRGHDGPFPHRSPARARARAVRERDEQHLAGGVQKRKRRTGAFGEGGIRDAADEARYLAILADARACATGCRPSAPGSSTTCSPQVAMPKSPIGPRALELYATLQENADYLDAHRVPDDGTDVTGADGIVYRFFTGKGLEFHPLANAAAAERARRRERHRRRGRARSARSPRARFRSRTARSSGSTRSPSATRRRRGRRGWRRR